MTTNVIEIYTYGGGTGLYDMFNAIAMLTHHQKGILVPIAYLCVILGSFWMIIRLLFSHKIEALFLNFAIPSTIIWLCSISVSTPVLVRDILAQTSYKVDNVPYLFALFTNLTSQLGYSITTGLESVLHKPNDAQYQKTGLIFGAQTAFDFNQYKITNANLEKNLNNFCKKCVFYDLSLGKYSIESLKKSPDIWKFFQDNTSKCRLVDYCTPIEKETSNKVRCDLISCKEAVDRMATDFKLEKQYYKQVDFAKQLPLSFQALTKLSSHNQDLISQQLMINVLTHNFPKRFAQTRAQGFLNETYNLMGSNLQTGIVSIRIILEAILYLSIVFVIPLAMLPGGFSTIKNWALMYVWIQLWPPFFVIINYIFQVYAQADASQIFAGLSETQKGLSLYTSVGAADLYKDVLAKCGFAYSLVPVISFAIIKGGAASFVSLANSFLQSEQSAASSAASEMLSGNYSFGNVQYGQMQYENTSAFQHNTAPMISDGYFQVNSGDLSKTVANGQTILRENLSDLASNISFETSIGSQLHYSKQMAENEVATTQESYNESISESYRQLYDLTTHLANGESYSNNLSSREAQAAHKAASQIWSDAEQFANHYNVASSDVLRGMVGLKLFGSGLETGSESSNAELESKISSYTASQDFQDRLERIRDFATTESYTDLTDEGVRIANSYADSLDKVETYQTNLNNAYTRMNQISETADSFDQSSLSTRKQMTQDFVNFTYQKCQEGNLPYSPEEILRGKNESLKDQLLFEFTQRYINDFENRDPAGYKEPSEKFDSNIPSKDFNQKHKEFEDKYPLKRGVLKRSQEELLKKGETISNQVQDQVFKEGAIRKEVYQEAEKSFEAEKERYLLFSLAERTYERAFENNAAYLLQNTASIDPLIPEPVDIFDPKYQ